MKTNELEQQLKAIFQHRRQLALSGILVGAMVLLLLLVIIPQFRLAVENRQQLSQEKEVLTRLRAKAADLDSALVSPEFLQADIVNQALPSKKPLLELLTSLGNVLVTSQVSLERLELSPGLIATNSSELSASSKMNNQDTLDLEIDVVGSFSQVENFMNLVEEMAPFTTISTFSLSDNVSGEGEIENNSEPQVRVSLLTKTHFFVQTVTQTLEKPLSKISNEEREVLRELSLLETPKLVIPNSITGGGQEDLFGVEGYAEELSKFYQSTKNLDSIGPGLGQGVFDPTHDIEPL